MISTHFSALVQRKKDEESLGTGKGTNPFDGASGLLLPLVAAQLHGAVNIRFSVVGAQDEQSAGERRTKDCSNVTKYFDRPYKKLSCCFCFSE